MAEASHPRPRSTRKVKFLLLLVLLALIGMVGVPLLNGMLYPPRPVEEAWLKGKSPNFRAAAEVMQKACVDCHGRAGHTPFYAFLPLIGDMVEHDIEEAREHFDLDKTLYAQGTIAPEILARIDHVIAHDEMPMFRYQIMHWSAFLSVQDRRVLRDWVRAERAAQHASKSVHPSLRGEPVQPLEMPTGLNKGKVELGRKLFHDTRLSGDQTVSCASCHSLSQGGTDQRPVSVGIGGQKGDINSPTVFNASLNVRQFWDGRAKDLHEQAQGPVTNPIEMGASWDQVVQRLREDSYYSAAFADLYDGTLDKNSIADAIATFEKTLITPDSPFDRYLKTGKAKTLGQDVQAGYALFKEAGCVKCHMGANLGGLSFERIKPAYFEERKGKLAKRDNGRYNVTGDPHDRHRFKVPSLRNIELTAPYFHDGQVETLEEAVRIMAKVQLGTSLSDTEVQQLVAFLRSLTGEYRGQSLSLR